jgi:MraZ protein
LGHYPARIDEKGRLKLPADVHRYVTELLRAESGRQDLFVTTLDGEEIRIYTRSRWKLFADMLAQETEATAAAADLLFYANEMGGCSDVDAQGRLLVPATLRRELNIENQTVHLACHQGEIDGIPPTAYERRRQRSRENRAEKLALFAPKGLR